MKSSEKWKITFSCLFLILYIWRMQIEQSEAIRRNMNFCVTILCLLFSFFNQWNSIFSRHLTNVSILADNKIYAIQEYVVGLFMISHIISKSDKSVQCAGQSRTHTLAWPSCGQNGYFLYLTDQSKSESVQSWFYKQLAKNALKLWKTKLLVHGDMSLHHFKWLLQYNTML